MPTVFTSALRLILQLMMGVGLGWTIDKFVPGKVPKPDTPKTGQGVMVFVLFFAAGALIWHLIGKLIKIPAKFR